MSNADLYALTPPAYTQSIANGEVTVDAEATKNEKADADGRSLEQSMHLHHPQEQPVSNAPSSGDGTRLGELGVEPDVQGQVNHPSTSSTLPSTTTTTPVIGHYLTDPVTTANLVGVRPCSILQDRPAIWLVKRRKMALSPLAAAVLTHEGLIRTKDLELYVHPCQYTYGGAC